MIELWIGLGLLFACVAVFFWAKSHPARQRAEAERRYRLDVEADRPEDS